MKPLGLCLFLILTISAVADPAATPPGTPLPQNSGITGDNPTPIPAITGTDAWLPMTPWGKDRITSETFKTPHPPAACVFNDRLYLFWRSNDALRKIYYSFTVTPGKALDWLASRHTPVANLTPHSVTACEFNGMLYLFWPTDDLRDSIYYSASADGETWPEGQPVGQGCGSPHSPAACVFQNRLYLFWTANDPSRHIMYTDFDPSAERPAWSAPRQINDVDSTNRPIAPCVYNNKLYIFCSANDSTNLIYYTASADGKTWPHSVAPNPDCTTINAPSACVFQNRLYLFWKASDNRDSIYWTNVPEAGNTWLDGQPVNQSATTAEAPVACVYRDKLCLFWKSNDDANFIYWTQLEGDSTATANSTSAQSH